MKSKGIRKFQEKEYKQKTGTANQYESSKISSRKNFFAAAEKISPSGCPMGKTAKMFRCFSLLGYLFYVDAAINEIGSWQNLLQN
ncbi:MAG: hypothetical protein ACTFAK_00215 [Candidatus Electronema sp. VV]